MNDNRESSTPPSSGRVRRFARDAGVSALVAFALFALLEAAFRIAAPQTSRTEPTSGGSRAVADSVLGHRYRPNAHARHRTPEFDVEYIINDNGRRDSTPATGDSLAVRVLVLGDSFTFGDGNAEGDVWTAVMERALTARGRRVDVVNAGVEGYDTRSEALYLEELEAGVRPDVVVLGFLANDAYTNTPAGTPVPPSANASSGRLFPLHTVEWAKRMLMQNDRAYARLFLMTSRREYYATPPGKRVERQIEITRQWLQRMETFCSARGIRFAVVSIPQQFAVIAGARDLHFAGVDPETIDRQLAPVARTSGFAWIEMLPELTAAYRSRGVDMFYRVDGHLTREGNHVVGEAAAAALDTLLAQRPAAHSARR